MQGESNEALAKYEGAKIISDADTSNAMNMKLATDTQKIYADLQSKAVAQQLVADNKASEVVKSKKTMEDTIVITTAAKKLFTEKEEAQKVVEKVATTKQKIADDALAKAKKIDTEAFAQ